MWCGKYWSKSLKTTFCRGDVEIQENPPTLVWQNETSFFTDFDSVYILNIYEQIRSRVSPLSLYSILTRSRKSNILEYSVKVQSLENTIISHTIKEDSLTEASLKWAQFSWLWSGNHRETERSVGTSLLSWYAVYRSWNSWRKLYCCRQVKRSC